jgi:uncharacterized protein YqhQ
MSSKHPQFNYGGQAVIEGVMMRGAHIAAIAVRAPDGQIIVHEEPLNATVYRGWISRVPFVRGLIGLWDALVLGTKALMWSANVALEEDDDKPKTGLTQLMTLLLGVGGGFPATALSNDPAPVDKPTPQQRGEEIFSGGVAAGILATSLAMGVGLFFVIPAAGSSFTGKLFGIENRLALDTIEGVIKLSIFIGYLAAIGMMEDVKRLFGYHGAEHKTINAYEAGDELTPERVQHYPIEHPRCGTAFLLTVVVLSIFIHSLTGRPNNLILLVLSRILVIPLIAGLAYEILRFTARNTHQRLVRAIIIPNLALQRLTTRQPDHEMLEVAITALQQVLSSEEKATQTAIPPVEAVTASAAALHR